MVIVEVPPNPNCEPADLRLFHDVEPPRPIRQVCLERTPGSPQWFEIVGWTAAGAPCPVWAQRVDDSGEGVAMLVSGGDAGVRLRPVASSGPWQVDDPQQWGAPFLLMADDRGALMYREDA